MPENDYRRLSPQMVRYLLNQINKDTGRENTQRDVARILGVSESAISMMKRRGAITYSLREESRDMMPFRIPDKFGRSTPAINLRNHLEYMATTGEGMNARKLRLLRGFYQRLIRDNVVVEFDPSIPPTPGIFTGGFAYRDRTPEDGNLIIRMNEHTRPLSAEERKVWAFPKVMP